MTLDAAFHEVKHDTPAAVKHTARKFGKERAEKQRIAIALSKAGMSKGGDETLEPTSMKYEAMHGRVHNAQDKAEFRNTSKRAPRR